MTDQTASWTTPYCGLLMYLLKVSGQSLRLSVRLQAALHRVPPKSSMKGRLQYRRRHKARASGHIRYYLM